MATICAFGFFDTEGARYWSIEKGLRSHGHTVVHCNSKAKGLIGKYRDLAKKWRDIECDILLVAFPGHYLMPLAWLLAKRRGIPVVLDIFISLYDTDVCDRKRITKYHPKAWLLYVVDWIACRLATRVLVDTLQHRSYFAQTFRVPPERFIVVPIASRSDLVYPKDFPLPKRWTVLFYGTFIPLQGIDTIIRAAALLQDDDIHVKIIGRGQTFPEMKKLAEDVGATNLEFADPVPMNELPNEIAKAHVSLGIFGTTPKADRVIPHKAVEVINCARPLITARTTASREIFTSGTNALLTTPGDPEDLARAIRTLHCDEALRTAIADGGRKLSLEKYQPNIIVADLHSWITTVHGAPLQSS